MEKQKEQLLREYNLSLPDGKEISFVETKGRNIFAVRKEFEKTYGKRLVDAVFGEPGHFEKAQNLLDEIKGKNVSRKKKHENIMQAMCEITNGAAKLDSASPIKDKYDMLYYRMPIKFYKSTAEPLWFPELNAVKTHVTGEQLRIAANWLENSGEANLAKRAYLEYVFELAHISLNEILAEILEWLN